MSRLDNLKDEANLIGETHLAITSGEAHRLRKKARVPLVDIATEAGVVVSTVFKWERQHRYPRHENAILYGRILRDLREKVSA